MLLNDSKTAVEGKHLRATTQITHTKTIKIRVSTTTHTCTTNLRRNQLKSSRQDKILTPLCRSKILVRISSLLQRKRNTSRGNSVIPHGQLNSRLEAKGLPCWVFCHHWRPERYPQDITTQLGVRSKNSKNLLLKGRRWVQKLERANPNNPFPFHRSQPRCLWSRQEPHWPIITTCSTLPQAIMSQTTTSWTK